MLKRYKRDQVIRCLVGSALTTLLLFHAHPVFADSIRNISNGASVCENCSNEFGELLDNTFIGTLLAGLILTYIGFRFYGRQKQIDLKFADLAKLRTTAAALFASVNAATSRIGGLFNMYDKENPTFNKIIAHVGTSIEDNVIEKTAKEIERFSTEITALTEELTSQLAINNDFEVDIDIVGQRILILNLYMQGISIAIKKLSPEEVKEWREGWNMARTAIVLELEKILKSI